MIMCFRIFVGLQHEFMVFDILISNLFISSVTFVPFTLRLHNSDYKNATHHFFGNLTFTLLMIKMHHIDRENDPPLCVYIYLVENSSMVL